MNSILKKSPLWLPLPKKGLIHFSDQQLAFPLVYQKRTAIVTVHDIIPLILQDDPLRRRLFYKLIFQGIRFAQHVIADSEHTKHDVVKYLHIPEQKISVIPLGVDHNVFFPSKSTQRDPATILYVGSEMPRKNVTSLLHAFAHVKKQIPQAKLVKIGASQWPNARQQNSAVCKKLGITDSVTWIDHAANLAGWYRKATVFVFPSLYEGFGLPVLEAMACGLPVVCSNKTSLPEITGKAALLCEPTAQNLAQHMLAILSDKKRALHLSRKGLEQAQQFSWKKCAEMTREIYRRFE